MMSSFYYSHELVPPYNCVYEGTEVQNWDDRVCYISYFFVHLYIRLSSIPYIEYYALNIQLTRATHLHTPNFEERVRAATADETTVGIVCLPRRHQSVWHVRKEHRVLAGERCEITARWLVDAFNLHCIR